MIANEPHVDNPTPPIVSVRPDDRQRWQHLLTEALARGLSIELDGDVTVAGRRYVTYQVSSHTSPGASYEVTVERWAAGAVGTRCGCKAGEFGSACTHGALAIDTACLWPLGMVIARQATLPSPDDRFEFHLTDRVRIYGTERTGVVSGIRMANGRPFYRVDDHDAHEPLGSYFSYELSPAAKPVYMPKVDQADALAVLMGRR